MAEAHNLNVHFHILSPLRHNRHPVTDIELIWLCKYRNLRGELKQKRKHFKTFFSFFGIKAETKVLSDLRLDFSLVVSLGFSEELLQ